MPLSAGSCLFIDLTARKARTQLLPESLLTAYVGGSALGTRLLLEKCQAGADPLGPENALVFACGALTGTMAPASSGHAVVTKSPLTGLLAATASFGRFSLALRRAGYSTVVITGVSPSPVYLLLDDGVVHFIKADHLKGKNTVETAANIRRAVGDVDVEVASIGPAGEKLVRYASIENGGYFPKRGGAGAVMGSKNLKAIAVRGNRPVAVADLSALQEFCLGFYARCLPESVARQADPTTCLLSRDRLHALPSHNFQQSSFEAAASLSQALSRENGPVSRTACPTCPVACGRLYKNGSRVVLLDCQALLSLGPLCGVGSAPAILEAAELCQLYGLDPVSCGETIAWAMEGFEKGIIKAPNPLDIDARFGDDTALKKMIEAIVHRTGLGDTLAEGTRMASVKIGQGSERWAMNINGMEISPCNPWSAKSVLQLALGLVDQSSCCDASSSDARLDQRSQDDLDAAFDSLMICKLAQPCFRDSSREASRLYSICSGREMKPADLGQLGQRAIALKRAFNLREGWRRSSDSLPGRLFSSGLASEGLNAATDDYYRSRGWTADGTVPESVFTDLGIEDALEFCRGE